MVQYSFKTQYSKNFESFQRPLLEEAVKWITGVPLIIVVLILVTIPLQYFGLGLNSDDSVAFLFFGLNFFTLGVIIGVTPIFRDLIAGLALITDKRVSRNELIRIVGVSGIGFVVEQRLRHLAIRCLDDTICYVPNQKLLRYPMISYSRLPTYVFEVAVPLVHPSDAATVRRILSDARTDLSILIKGSTLPDTVLRQMHNKSTTTARGFWNQISDPSGLSLTYGSDSCILLSLPVWDLGTLAATKRLQSDVLLYLTEILERYGARLNGPSKVVFRTMPLLNNKVDKIISD